MADPFEAENDDEWSQWFAALHDSHKAKVIAAVTGGQSIKLRDSNITHFPHRFFSESRKLTTLYLFDCSALMALPESLGQLQPLTTVGSNSSSRISQVRHV